MTRQHYRTSLRAVHRNRWKVLRLSGVRFSVFRSFAGPEGVLVLVHSFWRHAPIGPEEVGAVTLVLAGSSCLTLAASGCPTALIKLQGKAPPRLQCLRCLLHRLIHNRSVLQAGLPLGGYVRLCLGGGGVSPFGHLMLWQELDICSSSFTFAACLLTIVIIPILPAKGWGEVKGTCSVPHTGCRGRSLSLHCTGRLEGSVSLDEIQASIYYMLR